MKITDNFQASRKIGLLAGTFAPDREHPAYEPIELLFLSSSKLSYCNFENLNDNLKMLELGHVGSPVNVNSAMSLMEFVNSSFYWQVIIAWIYSCLNII